MTIGAQVIVDGYFQGLLYLKRDLKNLSKLLLQVKVLLSHREYRNTPTMALLTDARLLQSGCNKSL